MGPGTDSVNATVLFLFKESVDDICKVLNVPQENRPQFKPTDICSFSVMHFLTACDTDNSTYLTSIDLRFLVMFTS